MAKTARYSKNSVLYFRWDQSQYIYLIREGTVVLTNDIINPNSNGKYKKGDFVGLYAALGNFPYQEDAISETDVEVMMFSVDEFETLIANKPNLSLQLLQMLSHELRNTHTKAKRILTDSSAKVDNVHGLFSYVKLYTETGEIDKAKYVSQQFLKMYPNHSLTSEVKVMLEKINAEE